MRRAIRGALRRSPPHSLLLAAALTAAPLTVTAADLPVPGICVSAACLGFVSNGSATATVSGDTLTVNQTSANAVLNWRSFDISRDGVVNFIQPGSDSVALNRIFQSGASQIFGALNANGRVYLVNQNGFVFGQGATVNVAGLLASSLDIAPEALNADGSTRFANAVLQGRPAFQAFANGGASGDIHIAQGATIRTAEGGQVLVFAPNVTNEGRIVTPGGQAALAAGSSIYLTPSPSLAGNDYLTGVIIEVGPDGGVVSNGNAGNAGVTDPTQLAGQIIAERGNVTLAGLAVNQLGRVSATTSVKQGGSIRLVAGQGTTAQASTSESANVLLGTGGDLRLGQNSRTEVLLDIAGEQSVDTTRQPRSTMQMEGSRIVLESTAQVRAPNGTVTLAARENRAIEAEQFDSATDSTARIYLVRGATIDVSGADIEKSMESNVIAVELRGTELADSPLQRDGALRGQTVQVDIRQTGTREDGTTWYGTPVGDVSGYVRSIPKDVGERNLTGGTVNLRSQGEVILDGGSAVDLSGGSITFRDGYVNTSRVMDQNGAVYDIAGADPNRIYTRAINGTAAVIQDPRWGVVRTFEGFASVGRYETGYVEGKDAGTLSILGRTVLLQGDVIARTQAGVHQRRLPGAFDATALYRPFDQLPLAGQLILGQTSGLVTGAGRDYLLDEVRFSSTNAPPLGSTFDPWSGTLPLYYAATTLRAGLFGDDGIGRLTLRANGLVMLPEDVALRFPAAGSIDMRAGAVDIAGDITAHSGAIKLASGTTVSRLPLEGGLALQGGAVLDVSGLWVNDMAVANGGAAGTAALATRGGSVSLSAEENSVTLHAGSIVDASGGAQLTAAGRLAAGAAGSIAISTAPEALTGAAAPLAIDGELRAQGFQDGGSLSLTAAAFCVASASAQCVEDERDGLLRLAPAFFASGGFSAFTLTSNQGGIEVAPGQQVRLEQSNWQANGALSAVRSGTALGEFATTQRLPDIDRRAVDLSLNVRPGAPSGGTFNGASFADAASLEIGTGAAIVADAGAKVALTSSSRILVDGTIDAPAGDISLQLTANMNLGAGQADVGRYNDQGIWLGGNARLLAGGVARAQGDDLGRVTGEVLDGGTITLDADRGHVLTSANSVIDVSGTAAALDIRNGTQGAYSRQSVASAGGTIDIEASEAIMLGGELSGRSGAPGTVAAGTLRMTLDPTGRADPGQGGNVGDLNIFFAGARSIEVSQAATPVAFGDATLPASYRGRALMSAEQVAAGGFDAVDLSARSFVTKEGLTATEHLGTIAFTGDVNLEAMRRLTLNAAVIESDGGAARLGAALVGLGHGDVNFQSVAPALAGDGTLTIDAGQIDIVGNSALQGFEQATLRSRGDLRLSGVNVNDTLRGSLTTVGSLELAAAQVYPTTLTDFTIDAGGQDGQLTVSRTGNAAAALSAGARLTLRAPSITQSGTVRAPFGEIILESPSITLADGSITATSGAGLAVPFGGTQGGFDWVYELSNSKTLVYGPDGLLLPAQRITLDGDAVNVAAGATLDVRGGGELLASEFVPGTSGTRDVLSALNSPHSFAVLPAGMLASDAYDPAIYAGSNLAQGASVHLAAGNGLPEGDYIVLPARYALLPGAFLVTKLAGYQDIGAGESHARPDGSTVVSGYFTSTGTTLRDARTSGFAVLAGSDIQKRARYAVSSADPFFIKAAQEAGLEASRLPRDAGSIAIIANTSLALDGGLNATAGKDGRGAAVDISSDAIRIVGTDVPQQQGVLSIRDSDLNGLGAESILIGGIRDENSTIAIDTRSGTVSVAGGATLAAPEIMLTARTEVSLEEGSTLRAAGGEGATKDVDLQGDGAFLRVATSGVVNVERTNAGNAGVLQVHDGATVAADQGSITLESAGQTTLAGTLSATGGALNLVGSRISLGDVTGVVPGWVLSSEQLMALDLQQLVLSSRTSIDMYGDLSLALANLQLNAAALRGFGGEAQVTAAGNIDLRGRGDGAVVPAGGTGTLNLSAGNVRFQGGELAVSGFSNVGVHAQQEVRASKSSGIGVDGALDISAQRVATASGVDLAMHVTGAATVAAAGAAADISTDLGGSLSLEASTVEVSGRLELPSGAVELTSTAATQGGVRLADGAIIDVSGRSTDFAGEAVGSGGGRIAIAARSGDVTVAGGTRLDVSGAGNAAAGSVALSATAGTLTVAGDLRGTAADPRNGGDFSADAAVIGDFAALNRQLNSGGLSGERSVRQRGVGDLTVLAGADNEVRGTRVALSADQGSIIVEGGIRAHAPDGGRVLLSARDGIEVEGSIDARASGAERDGRIDLRVGEGGLRVVDGATVASAGAGSVSGSAADGTVRIRLSQDTLDTVLDADAGNDTVQLGGNWSAKAVAVEGFKSYEDADGVIDSFETSTDPGNVYFADAEAFGTRADAIRTALAAGGPPNLSVQAGIEITSAQALQLDADWDLSQWRFGGHAGVLTLRAAGDLLFNASLSDGFTGTTGANAFTLTNTDPTWSYRLESGGTLAVAGGDASVRDYLMIRTGTGSVDIQAAQDVVLTNEASMIYTAGSASPGTLFPSTRGNGNELGSGLNRPALLYPVDGGDISISAGNDVVGAASSQLVTDWLWRIGNTDGVTRSTAWTVNFASFHQNVGALGGGDVAVRAGRNVDTLSVSTPTIGRQTGSKTGETNQVTILGGGTVKVNAGSDIAGGTYYSGRGSIELEAGAAVRASTQTGLSPLLALGDAQASIRGRQDVQLETVVNPTLLPQAGGSQGNTGATRSFFSTYTDDSAVHLESVAGDASVVGGTRGDLIQSLLTTVDMGQTASGMLRLFAPTLSMQSLRGDVVMEGDVTLLPSAHGRLDIRAHDDVRLRSIIVSDMDLAQIPSVERPSTQFLSADDPRYDALTSAISSAEIFNADHPVRMAAALDGTLRASRIVAATGDVNGDSSALYFGAPLEVRAGRDVTDLNVIAQNLTPASVTTVSAGRDIAYSVGRDTSGVILNNTSQLTVDGPGQLALAAGRDINLQNSVGISTRGNLVNTALSNTGAGISAVVGLNGHLPDYAGFGRKYLVESAQYASVLASYLERVTGTRPATADASLLAFAALDENLRSPFLQQVLLAELRASTQEAASDDPVKHGNYSRGFAALEAMFPGSSPAAGSGTENPYRGDLALYFSRIYTQDGGDITLLAPGGGVNAGLATPPDSFGVSKRADQLGIVTQRGGNIGVVMDQDLLVNESRMFAIDDSDIVVWSSNGDIDAGRGAKTAISAPSPIVTYDSDGRPSVIYSAALAGSGIQTRATTADREPGDVVLAAPRGVVNAGDAGIVAGNLTIAATAVLGADNIKVSGVAVGVPVDTGGLGASLSGVSAAASGAASAATASVDAGSQKQEATPMADTALSWLDVFVVGLGEEGCKQDDVDCLKRQKVDAP